MDESQLDYLRANQQELGLKLLRRARYSATNYGWVSGKTLPLGKDPEDIVIAVVDDYLYDRRHFNPKYDIEVQLKRAVDSDLTTKGLDELRQVFENVRNGAFGEQLRTAALARCRNQIADKVSEAELRSWLEDISAAGKK